VVISSCDRYRDVWKPFFTLFFRYWPNCPFPIYLVANHLHYDDPKVITVNVGQDYDWSSSFREGLQGVPYSYVILLLEDFLLVGPVDNARVLEYVECMKAKQAACLQLFRVSRIVGSGVPSSDDPRIGILRKGAPYRVSLQTAVWDKRVICELLKDGESAQEFEIRGTARSKSLQRLFLSLNPGVDCPIPYYPLVVTGKWHREGVLLCERENIPLDLNARPQLQVTTIDNIRSQVFVRWASFKCSVGTRVASVRSSLCKRTIKWH